MIGIVYANLSYCHISVRDGEDLFPKERDRRDDYLLHTWGQISRDFEIPTTNKQSVLKAAARVIHELALMRAFLGDDLPVLRFHSYYPVRPNKRCTPESPVEVPDNKRIRIKDFTL